MSTRLVPPVRVSRAAGLPDLGGWGRQVHAVLRMSQPQLSLPNLASFAVKKPLVRQWDWGEWSVLHFSPERAEGLSTPATSSRLVAAFAAGHLHSEPGVREIYLRADDPEMELVVLTEESSLDSELDLRKRFSSVVRLFEGFEDASLRIYRLDEPLPDDARTGERLV